jgi:CDP-diacylglycerol--serine O-phosphatidyltransferase
MALLMVSNVRYRSFKSLNLKRRESFFALVSIAVILFIVASAPSVMIFLFSLLYVASGLIEEGIYQARKKNLVAESSPFRIDSGTMDEKEPFRVIDGKA